MLKAKNKFRQGFILLKQPFYFTELKCPIQKFTIIWAYAEQPILKSKLTPEAKEKIEEIHNTTSWLGLFRMTVDDKIEQLVGRVMADIKSYEQIYEGEIVQSEINGVTCRFYPDEYKVMSMEAVQNLLEEEGYHTIIDKRLYDIKEFKDKVHYLQSRGLEKSVSEKWCSMMYKDLVYYKPYYNLLKMFARENEIYPDNFYHEVEGIETPKVPATHSN